MNIEDLTLRQIREISALTLPEAQPKAEPLASYVGLDVVVRSVNSGVWIGRCVAVNGSSIELVTARRAYYWTGAGSCSGLATTGPTGGKWPMAVRVLVMDCCEVIAANAAAMAAVTAQPVWSGRE